MQIKDILVQIDTTASSDARLDLALGLAGRHGAHLIGLHILDVPQFIGLRTGMVGPGISIALATLVDRVREEAQQAAAGVEAGFRERLRREGVEGEWRFVQDWLPETIALHARYADLAVLGQEDPHAPRMPDRSAVIEHVLFSSGRPVLIVPHAGRFETVGRRVLVGWNAGREAARAVNDALPLMAGAEAVTVLAVNPRRGVGGHGDVPAADIALHLARHGVKATAAYSVGKEISEADALLNQAADLAADLIVVGAYGHSRLRELVMGGVTRSLLNRMTCPVLMSH